MEDTAQHRALPHQFVIITYAHSDINDFVCLSFSHFFLTFFLQKTATFAMSSFLFDFFFEKKNLNYLSAHMRYVCYSFGVFFVKTDSQFFCVRSAGKN